MLFLIRVIVVVLAFIVSALSLPHLPASIPMHWNFQGQVDSYWPKETAVWFMPILGAVMLVLFRIMPHLDPKKDKYRFFEKEWGVIQTVFIIFFAYLHFVILYISMNTRANILPYMFSGLGLLFIFLGNYMSKIRQNYFIGIRVPWTLASEDNWNKTHRFASWCFVITGFLILMETFIEWNAPLVIFSGIFLSSVVPIVYSYWLFRQKTA